MPAVTDYQHTTAGYTHPLTGTSTTGCQAMMAFARILSNSVCEYGLDGCTAVAAAFFRSALLRYYHRWTPYRYWTTFVAYTEHVCYFVKLNQTMLAWRIISLRGVYTRRSWRCFECDGDDGNPESCGRQFCPALRHVNKIVSFVCLSNIYIGSNRSNLLSSAGCFGRTFERPPKQLC